MIKFTNANDFKYNDYIYPVIKVFQDYKDGKILSSKEIKERVITLLEIPDKELSVMLNNNRFFMVYYRVDWAIAYALRGEYIERVSRGNYVITQKGLDVKSANDLNQFWKQVQFINKENKSNISEEGSCNIENQDDENYEDKYKEDFLEKVRNFHPTQFEMFCKDLLKEMGVKNIVHTGKPNDKGLDVSGDMLVDNFITYRIAFQCKRYARDNKISSADIYQFMGSPTIMSYDKCVFITTSYYKIGVSEEMKKYGSKLTLIDADALWDLVKKYEFGVQKKQVAIINYELLNKYQNT